VDIYLNETTRYANVILPPPPSLARSHYDLALYQLAVHNVANYSPPILEREPGTFDEWEIFLRLAGILVGQGSTADIGHIDDLSVTTLIQREITTPGSFIEGRDMGELLEALKPHRGPERILDFLLRSGPYGDGFGTQDGLSLTVLEAHPHGVDLGPLQPRIPEVLRTPSGMIELAPQPIVTDVERLRVSLENNQKRDHGQMLLIGRRDLRSNNSWMHNLHVLAKGKERCTLHIHPDDAARLALANGEMACITSGEQTVEIPIEITGAIMPGVVSIPHGWGHNLADTKMHIASEHAGVNANILTRGEDVDPLSGNAILNGVSVTVQKVLALSLSDAS
jgi:anaerobic selenocysteine-containing dehydrogenase